MNGRISYTPEYTPDIAEHKIKDALKNVSVASPVPGRGGNFKVAMPSITGIKKISAASLRKEVAALPYSRTIHPPKI